MADRVYNLWGDKEDLPNLHTGEIAFCKDAEPESVEMYVGAPWGNVMINKGPKATLTYTIAPYNCPEPYRSRADLVLTEDGAANTTAINNAIEELNAARLSDANVICIQFLSGDIAIDKTTGPIEIQWGNVWLTGNGTSIVGTGDSSFPLINVSGVWARINGLRLNSVGEGIYNSGEGLIVTNCAIANDVFNGGNALYSTGNNCIFKGNKIRNVDDDNRATLYSTGDGCKIMHNDIQSMQNFTEALVNYGDGCDICYNTVSVAETYAITSYGLNTFFVGNRALNDWRTFRLESSVKPGTLAALADLNFGDITLV